MAAAAIAWTVVYWLAALLLGPEPHRVETWKVDVQFVFSGADRGQYPNGMPFAASDLLSPVVLERVLDDIDGLPADVDAAWLGDRLAVSAHFPDASELRQQYRQRLGGDLSLAEIRELESAFSRDFERGARTSARLFLITARNDLPVPELLQAIPAAWADYMREEYGVFRTNRTLYSARAVSADMFTESDPLMVYLILRQQVGLLQENVGLLQEEPNSGNVRDPESGLGLADIRARASQLEELVLEGQLPQVLEVVVYQNPEQAQRFLEVRVAQQQQNLALLQSKSAAVDQALGDYDIEQSTSLEGVAVGLGAGGEDFLSRLIALGVEGGDLGFRQELTRERLEYDLEAAGVASNIQRLGALLTEMDLPLPAETSADEAERVFLEEISDQLDRLVVSIRSLFEATERLAGHIDQLRYGEDGRMFSLGALPDEPEWQSGRFTVGHWQWYAVSLVAVLLGAGLLLLAGGVLRRTGLTAHH
ncbi:MAG: hypothetical protein ACOCVP_04990 [Wenzhouxiangella sp.]